MVDARRAAETLGKARRMWTDGNLSVHARKLDRRRTHHLSEIAREAKRLRASYPDEGPLLLRVT